jgi:hypothetical protein
VADKLSTPQQMAADKLLIAQMALEGPGGGFYHPQMTPELLRAIRAQCGVGE